MANPVNENLPSWQPDHAGADTNHPNGSDPAGIGDSQEFAGNIRLLKSVFRIVAANLSWERPIGIKNIAGNANIAFTYASATSFTINDNFTSSGRDITQIGRRVRAQLGSGALIYGSISVDPVWSSPNTTVTVVWDSGALDATVVEITFGPQARSVGGVQGIRFLHGVPGNGQCLAYNSTLNAWVFSTPPSGVTDHGQLSGLNDNDHPQYQLVSAKGAVDGYAPLDGGAGVPTGHLGGGTPNSTNFLRGDRQWAVPPQQAPTPPQVAVFAASIATGEATNSLQRAHLLVNTSTQIVFRLSVLGYTGGSGGKGGSPSTTNMVHADYTINHGIGRVQNVTPSFSITSTAEPFTASLTIAYS